MASPQETRPGEFTQICTGLVFLVVELGLSYLDFIVFKYVITIKT